MIVFAVWTSGWWLVIVFRSAVLPKPRAQTEMADDKVTKNGRQNFAECLAGSFSSSSGRLQYLQIATSWLKFQMSPKLLTLARVIFVYNKRSHQLSWTVWIQTGLSMIAKESWNDHQLSSNIMTVWTGRNARDVSFRNS